MRPTPFNWKDPSSIPLRSAELTDRIGTLTAAAEQLEAPPAYECDDSVQIHPMGEPLTKPIHWQGRQWAVTAYGIEKRDGTYVIEADRYEDTLCGWVNHMAVTKDWVDLDDFAEALRIARRLKKQG
jgi:hypothetical protein